MVKRRQRLIEASEDESVKLILMCSFVLCHKVKYNSLLTVTLMCSLSAQRHRFHDKMSAVRVFTRKIMAPFKQNTLY
jgi:hypothetical protein